MRSEPLLGSSSFQNWKGMLHAIINRLKFQLGVRNGTLQKKVQHLDRFKISKREV